MDPEDQNSILFQAMKNEMYPQVEQAGMKFIDPNTGGYQVGVGVRTPPMGGGGGGGGNPLKMTRSPENYAGRPTSANDNPANVSPQYGAKFNDVPMRPAGNVINQYEPQLQRQKIDNMIRQEMEIMAARKADNPGMISRGLKSFRNFMKGMDFE
jgi:hypothetical protein